MIGRMEKPASRGLDRKDGERSWCGIVIISFRKGWRGMQRKRECARAVRPVPPSPNRQGGRALVGKNEESDVR